MAQTGLSDGAWMTAKALDLTFEQRLGLMSILYRQDGRQGGIGKLLPFFRVAEKLELTKQEKTDISYYEFTVPTPDGEATRAKWDTQKAKDMPLFHVLIQTSDAEKCLALLEASTLGCLTADLRWLLPVIEQLKAKDVPVEESKS